MFSTYNGNHRRRIERIVDKTDLSSTGYAIPQGRFSQTMPLIQLEILCRIVKVIVIDYTHIMHE
jgi:hypothetical protein